MVVRFPWEDGEVIHVVSHFYRQLDTNHTPLQAAEVIEDVSGLTSAQRQQFKASEDGAVNMGDVESSYAFQKMTSNLVVGKARKNEAWRTEYRWTSKKKLEQGKRSIEAGTRIKILEQEGDHVRVRAESGDELVVQMDALTLLTEGEGAN